MLFCCNNKLGGIALYYTYHNLTDTDIDFFHKLNDKEELSFNGLPSITICHGSPDRVNEKLLPDNENTFSIMDNNKADYILCGHTHIQGVITHNQKVVWNAGSVGVPLHSNGKAQFLILSSTEDFAWKSEFISLDYNVEKVIDDLHVSGLYKKAWGWSAVSEYLLRTGKISHGNVLARAMFLCREKTGQCNWPDVPEEYWKLAVKEMIPKTCINQFDNEFWHALDELVFGSEIVIDRPKGTVHPRFSHMIYQVDYGYLKNTASMDGSGIDVWVGTKEDKNADAIICTVDLMKKDSEIKILIGCTEEEKEIIYKVHNESQYMKDILIRRSIV